MSEGKWIADVHAGTPLKEAARRVLHARLEVVRAALPPALEKPYEDPEHIHQLRVASRRAGAALRVFADCLPGKARRAARRRVRHIRRAAGEARDWDVFLAGLRDSRRRPAKAQPGFDYLLGYAHGQRAAAQASLEQAIGPDGCADFAQLVSETVAAVRSPHPAGGRHTLLDLARPALLDLLGRLDEAAARDLGDYANLHGVRLVGKRLRYAMELFASCFGPMFRDEFYPAVEEMQETLGQANDSHVAAGRLRALRMQLRTTCPDEWPRLRPGIESWLRHHDARLPRERRRFLQWWRHWQSSNAEAKLAVLLRRPASRAV